MRVITAFLFGLALSAQDAKGILTGGNTAATGYFRKTTSAQLTEKFLPIVTRATSKVGLAEKYNNVVDLAVGVIIGGAFGKIVSSFVEDVIMPPIGMILGGVDFKTLAITLKAAEGKAAAVMINYGKFIQTVVDFTIIAFVIFIAIKAMNSLKRKAEAAPPPLRGPTAQEILLTEIRDALRAK